MSSVRRVIMSSISNALSFKHGLSLWCPQSTSVNQISQPCSVSSKIFRRRFSVLASSFANENREFVIVGGGNASGYAARTFVEHGMADGKLCIVSKEAYVPYERPALTKAYLFPLDKKPARLPGFHTCVGAGGERQTPDWYKEKGIEMLHEDPVADIDTEKQTLTTNSGKLLKYGSLIIATGCTASRFPDKIGGNLPGVHYVRDVADANSLISSLEKSKKVVVVGGGYIGMEVAAATVAWKLDTTIIFPEDHLMTRLFTPSLAQKYEDLYKDYGVNFVKGASIKSLEAGSDGRVSGVKLENGSIIEADTVVIGIGGKPAVGPFESVGLNKTVGGIQKRTCEAKHRFHGKYREFAEWLLTIGDGIAGDPNVGEVDVELPQDILIRDVVDPIAAIVDSTYPSLMQNMRDMQFFQDRAILAPTNEMVEKINDYVMSLLLDEKVVYMSSDNICITVNGDVEEHEEIFFIELLNQTKCFGLPNHIIKLKVECIVMLLRNIDQSRELYNGTRLIVTKLTTRVIEAQIISSKNVGQNVLIGRMVLSPYDTTKFSVMFQRKQFPLAVCYAMIINKSQRQSLSHVGLYLSSDVFSHGQLSMYLSSDVFSHGQLSRRD